MLFLLEKDLQESQTKQKKIETQTKARKQSQSTQNTSQSP